MCTADGRLKLALTALLLQQQLLKCSLKQQQQPCQSPLLGSSSSNRWRQRQRQRRCCLKSSKREKRKKEKRKRGQTYIVLSSPGLGRILGQLLQWIEKDVGAGGTDGHAKELRLEEVEKLGDLSEQFADFRFDLQESKKMCVSLDGQLKTGVKLERISTLG